MGAWTTGKLTGAALGIVAVVAWTVLIPTNPALGINPVFCGKGVGVISAPVVGSGKQAVAAQPNPYRVLATYHYRNSKRPQDERVLRLGTAAWGFTHIRARRGWKAFDTFVIVGCVLTYGRPVARQGNAYTFRCAFPSGAPGRDVAGREFEVIYETSSGPKGVITAYPTDLA